MAKLLAGGNPQIPKGDGDVPVQDYLAAMPDWKQGVGRRLDQIITATIPEVHKAVRWNTPFYGIRDKGWFLGFHCLTNYVKVNFLRGAILHPVPPIESKDPHCRYLHIPESGEFDEEQFTSWVEQAAELDGASLF